MMRPFRQVVKKKPHKQGAQLPGTVCHDWQTLLPRLIQ